MSIYEDDREAAAIGVAIATLAAVLERNGKLSRSQFAAALRQAWLAMPDDEALGEGGAFIQQLLGLLDEPVVGEVAPARPRPPARGWYHEALRLLIPHAA